MNDPETPVFRYEQLIENDADLFWEIARHCEFRVTKDQVAEIVARNSFENIAGRNRGQEDVNSHFRKGVAGDWKNYFTPAVKERFKEEFGEVLIQTGYESDLNW
jgi:lipopolysaccharide transport system ATP-binding protein